MANPRPELLPVDPAGIPEQLKATARWAPWRAVWNEKRGKWDKIPCHPSGYGLSTRRPAAWVSFAEAMASYQRGGFAGVGYLMTGAEGLVGVDLDRCVQGGQLAPWAREVLQALGGYAERSPVDGARAFVNAAHGLVPWDWNNHDVGIEVYAGHTPRFLTVTGQRLGAADISAAPAGVLEDLGRRFAREREQATVISLAMPDLLDELALPDVATLDLPPRTRDLLTDGATGADRSRDLFTAAVDLFRLGLAEDVVLSILANNPHTMGIALDHRRQDPERALMYLWVEHTQKGKTRAASSRLATADDFEDVSPSEAPLAKAMFDIVPAWQFMGSKPLRWLLKGLIPHAAVGAVYGASGAGKSFLVIDMAISIARGIEWRGFRCKQADVLYVAAEGAAGVMQRLQAHCLHHGYDMRDVPLQMLGKAPNILQVDQVQGLVKSIKARCSAATRLIVLDTLAQVTPGANENSSEDMGRAVAHCQTISEATGAMVLLVAHAGKDGERGLRGWSGIKGALDVELLVEKEGKYHGATVTKMKDGTNEGLELPFSLVSVAIGVDEDGDAVGSAVLADGSTPRDKAPPKGKNQQLVLEVLATVADMGSAPTEAELVELVVAQMPEDKGGRVGRMRAKDALRALEANGRISIEGGRVVERA